MAVFRERVAEHYRSKGYQVHANARVRGGSGNVYVIDLVCEGAMGNLLVSFGDAGGLDGAEMGAVRRIAKDLGMTPVLAAEAFSPDLRHRALQSGVVLLDASLHPSSGSALAADIGPWPGFRKVIKEFEAHPWPASGQTPSGDRLVVVDIPDLADPASGPAMLGGPLAVAGAAALSAPNALTPLKSAHAPHASHASHAPHAPDAPGSSLVAADATALGTDAGSSGFGAAPCVLVAPRPADRATGFGWLGRKSRAAPQPMDAASGPEPPTVASAPATAAANEAAPLNAGPLNAGPLNAGSLNAGPLTAGPPAAPAGQRPPGSAQEGAADVPDISLALARNQELQRALQARVAKRLRRRRVSMALAGAAAGFLLVKWLL